MHCHRSVACFKVRSFSIEISHNCELQPHVIDKLPNDVKLHRFISIAFINHTMISGVNMYISGKSKNINIDMRIYIYCKLLPGGLVKTAM